MRVHKCLHSVVLRFFEKWVSLRNVFFARNKAVWLSRSGMAEHTGCGNVARVVRSPHEKKDILALMGMCQKNPDMKILDMFKGR